MDTVWLVLHKVSKSEDGKQLIQPKSYMFGPTGVTSFWQEGELTVVQDSKGIKETVEECPSDIFGHIGRIRKTIKPAASAPKKKNNGRKK